MATRGRWTRRAALVLLALAALGLVGLALEGVTPTRGGDLDGTGRNGGTPVGAREVVGCSGGSGGAVVASGPRSQPYVALTFDDGPSGRYTPRILAILERLHARATFFEEGRHVAGHEALMRRILARGDEIGNHSYSHPLYPGYRELAAANRAIRAATGFTPCLFRPPYGLLDARVREAARRNRLTTVLWDDDSGDSKHPSAALTRANAIGGARPGSIVLMHDGGRHPRTVTALPGIVRGLRARGFRFTTVTGLLGGRFLYRGGR